MREPLTFNVPIIDDSAPKCRFCSSTRSLHTILEVYKICSVCWDIIAVIALKAIAGVADDIKLDFPMDFSPEDLAISATMAINNIEAGE